MVKRYIVVLFCNKKGLELAKTLVYILIAIGIVLVMWIAVSQAANKILN